LTFDGDARKLAFALNAIGSQDAVKPIVALLDSGKVPSENLPALWQLLAQIGGTPELDKVLKYAAVPKSLSLMQRLELIRAVEETVRTRKIGPPGECPALAAIVAEGGELSRCAMHLIGLWKLEKYRTKLESLAASPEVAAPEDRFAALEGLALFGDASAKNFIGRLASANQKADVRRLAIIALAGLDTLAAAESAAAFLPDARPQAELVDLYSAFLNRKAGGPTLAKALAGKKLNPEVAKIGLQAVRSSALPAPELTDAMIRAGELSAASKPPTDAEVKAMAAEAQRVGSAERGEVVFRRKELQCLACHGIGGAGGQVGPDMTSIGASAQVDYLVESIVLPSKAIKEGYHSLRIATLDDKVYLGIKLREANGLLTLRTADDKEATIAVKDIAERSEAKSLMPEGLTDTLSQQEFADLVKFLSELGKIGPYAPNKARIVRRWQTIEPASANLELFRRNRISAAAEADAGLTWASAYARVSGNLPLKELPKFSVWANGAEQTVLRFQLDVTAAGKVGLKFNGTDGLTLFAGPRPVEIKAQTIVDLEPGMQSIVLIVDRSIRREDIRVELEDVPNSPIRVAIVGGK
jgi:putative heme-binding domain-containing protein